MDSVYLTGTELMDRFYDSVDTDYFKYAGEKFYRALEFEEVDNLVKDFGEFDTLYFLYDYFFFYDKFYNFELSEAVAITIAEIEDIYPSIAQKLKEELYEIKGLKIS